MSTYLMGDFLMPGAGLPAKALEQAQAMHTEPSHSSASAFHHQPQVSGWALSELGVGGSLTLRADGSLPAFLADTCEGLAVDHTGAPVVAGAGQAAAVPGCETRPHFLRLWRSLEGQNRGPRERSQALGCPALPRPRGWNVPMLQVVPSQPPGHMHLKASPSS